MTLRYTIQRGDTLSEISKNLGISMQEIATLNKIEDVDFIKAGEELVLPEPRESLLQEPIEEAPEPIEEALEPIAEAPEPIEEAPEPRESLLQDREDLEIPPEVLMASLGGPPENSEDEGLWSDIGENISGALEERREKIPGIVEDFNLDRSDWFSPEMQVTARVAGHIAGAVMSDVVGETLGTAGRRYVPQSIQDTYDAAVLSVGTALAETKVGQKFLKHLEENPGDAKNLAALGDISSAIPAMRLVGKAPSALGSIGKNLETKIDLYSSPQNKVKDLAKKATKSAAISLLDSVSARRQAAKRVLAGGSLSKAQEALGRQKIYAAKLAESKEKIKELKDSGNVKEAKELEKEIRESKDSGQYGEAAAVASAFLNRQSSAGTYNILEDVDMTFDQTPLGVKYFEPGGLDIPATDTKQISRVMAKGYSGPPAPPEVLENFLKEMLSFWKIRNPETTSVNVQRLGGPRSVFLEASPTVLKDLKPWQIPKTIASPKATSKFSSILGSQNAKVINSKEHPKGWAKSINKELEDMDESDWKNYLTSLEWAPSPSTMEGQKLLLPKGRKYDAKTGKLSEGAKSKMPSTREEWKTYLKQKKEQIIPSIARLRGPVEMEKLDPKFWEANGKKYVSFRQAHTSEDKVLGGVSDYMTIDITGGKNDIQLFTIISDAHDLKVIGKDLIPPGGSELINVFPSVTHNISKGVTHNVKDKDFLSAESIQDEVELAAKKFEESTGVERLPNERGSSAQHSQYQRRVMLELAEGATPLLRDRVKAASNISLLASTPTIAAFSGEQGESKVLRSLKRSLENN